MQQSHREIISGSAVKAENSSSPQVDRSPSRKHFPLQHQIAITTVNISSVSSFDRISVSFIQMMLLKCFNTSFFSVRVERLNRWLSDWLSDTPALLSPACPLPHWHESQHMSQVGCKMRWRFIKSKNTWGVVTWRAGKAAPGCLPSARRFVRAHQVTADRLAHSSRANQTTAPALFRPDEDAVWQRRNRRATVGDSLHAQSRQVILCPSRRQLHHQAQTHFTSTQ